MRVGTWTLLSAKSTSYIEQIFRNEVKNPPLYEFLVFGYIQHKLPFFFYFYNNVYVTAFSGTALALRQLL